MILRTHTSDHREEDNKMFLMLRWKAQPPPICMRHSLTHQPLLVFLIIFIFIKKTELPLIKTDYNFKKP
jgi:hypothetical protein